MDDYENFNILIEAIGGKIQDTIHQLTSCITDMTERLRELVQEIIKTVKKVQNKPKYKFIKNLYKPYRQPFIKVKAKARSNL